MRIEARCSDCKHRAPRYICGEPHSPFFSRHVKSTDACEHFLANPAEEHFAHGLAELLNEGQPERAISHLKKAIEIGLPEDAEMQAHYFLGVDYRQLLARLELPTYQIVDHEDFTRTLKEFERALTMDRDGRYGYFADPLHRAGLSTLDTLYALKGSALADSQSAEVAIKYLEDTLKICEYLTSSPLLRVLWKLGILYAENGNNDMAASCFLRIIQAEPVDRIDDPSQEFAIREAAQTNLRMIAEESRAARISRSGCMLLLTALGWTSLTVSCAVVTFP